MDVTPNLTTETDKETGTKVVKNKDTNEPILNLTNSSRYRKNQVAASYHPDFLIAHPEIENSLIHRTYNHGYGSDTAQHPNAGDAIDKITPFLKSLNNGDFKKDPVAHTYGGENIGQGTHMYHLHDDDGNKFGTLHSVSPERIHGGHGATFMMDKKYIEDNNISDHIINAARNKFSGDNVDQALHRARYILDNKNKEPRFVGDSSDNSKTNVYKTKLAPEKASSDFEEAMRKQHEAEGHKVEVIRHSPTAFTMKRNPTDKHDFYGKIHHVMSFPGELHHTESTLFHPDSPYKRKNSTIIESVDESNGD